MAEARAAVALAPKSAEVHDELGSVLAQGGQLPEAEQEFQTALQIDPNYQPAHFHLGVVRLN